LKNILAIPGSLRSGSSNHAVLRYLQSLIPPGFGYTIYDNLAKIPPFDPGNDHDLPPDTVTDFRNLISNADGIIICTPEYAFGVPGQLKNALDWTVSNGSFSGKPTALITASTGGQHAHEALINILGAIDAQLNANTTLLISYIRSKLNADGEITDSATKQSLHSLLGAFLTAIS
jgi:chromate reductase, NAD(P)H dehydrogenase (quinone)